MKIKPSKQLFKLINADLSGTDRCFVYSHTLSLKGPVNYNLKILPPQNDTSSEPM